MARVWDSKGSGKTGGKDYKPPHDSDRNDEGPLACGACNGTGTVTRRIHSTKGEDWDDQDCTKCDGTGYVS